MDYYKLQSLTIDWLRFPMMVAVVFIHINPSVNIQEVDYSNFSWEGVYAIVATLGSRVLPHVAVPFFFFTSGYFYFYKIETFVYGEYVKKTYKRLQTLVVPYLVWILIALIVMFLLKPFIENTPRWEYYDFTKKHFYNLFWDYYSNGGDRKSNIFGERVSFSAPYNFPLWFLRDLIVITLFSPLIYFLTKRGKLLFIIILFSLFYTHVWFNIPGFSIEAAFFFSFGAYFSLNKKNIIVSILQYKKTWFLIALSTLMLSIYYDRTPYKYYFFPIYRVSGLLSFMLIVSELLNKNYLRTSSNLSGMSFFIFLSHTILIQGISREIVNFIIKSKDSFFLLIKYVLTPIMTVTICAIIYSISKRYTPKFLSFILGSRNN